jgi:hypothetical protein
MIRDTPPAPLNRAPQRREMPRLAPVIHRMVERVLERRRHHRPASVARSAKDFVVMDAEGK